MKELEEIIICACENVQHQVIIRTVEGWEDVAVSIHLKHLPFFKRLWHGIKYIFGHKSKYGDFDEIIIAPKDVDKIKKVVEWLEANHQKQDIMDSINTAMQKAFWDTDIPDFPPIAFEQGYEMGANYVLEQFENILPHTAKKGVIYGIIKETIEKLNKR